MNFNIHIYGEEQAPPAAEISHSRPLALRPLLHDGPREQDESLERGVSRLSRELRRQLTELARSARHEDLAAISCYPSIEERILKLTLEVGNRRFAIRHLFILLSAFGRRFAWTLIEPAL